MDKPKATTFLHARISEEQKERLRKAAEHAGQSLSAYVLQAAEEKAEHENNRR